MWFVMLECVEKSGGLGRGGGAEDDGGYYVREGLRKARCAPEIAPASE